jgi:hypothetical protein
MVLLAFLILQGMRGPALAQGSDAIASFITPFPDNDTYRVYVFGDSLAEGITGGLADAFKDDSKVEVVRKARARTGFTRLDQHDWIAGAKEIASKEKFHIAVVLLGSSDRQPIRTDKRPVLVGTDEWKLEYGRRVDQFLKTIRKPMLAIYWVGLPVVKDPKASDEMQFINSVFREKVFLNGGRFIDTWNGFTDENGRYQQDGPDLSGKIRRLREADGIHFTKDGYRKLAHFVEREMRRDLAIARAERNVPLAGGEAEQRRVNPQRAVQAAVAEPQAQARARQSPATAQAQQAASTAAAQQARRAADADLAGLEQKADHGRIAVTLAGQGGGRPETLTIDILRPTIPAQVIAHVSRRGAAAESGRPQRAAQMGESVTSEIAGGLTLMSSVTTVNEVSLAGRRGAVQMIQSPHYKVLVKGERIEPKPGRADDFRWPRPDAVATGPRG